MYMPTTITTEEDSRHTSENENSGQNESGNEGALDDTGREGIEGSINRSHANSGGPYHRRHPEKKRSRVDIKGA